MLFLFNTFSVRLSANMKMMMIKLNKIHVLFFVATNIVDLFFKKQQKNEKTYFLISFLSDNLFLEVIK